VGVDRQQGGRLPRSRKGRTVVSAPGDLAVGIPGEETLVERDRSVGERQRIGKSLLPSALSA
ncbi:MAG: hypothetical protein ACRDGB_01840, partial [Candidatus Limnocylindria bacterium]